MRRSSGSQLPACCADLNARGKNGDTMKIIAVTNIKGGVGKTTTAVNLSYLCAAVNGATLLWDLDPQGAATYTFRGDPVEHASPKKLLNGKRHLPELILSTGYPNLDLLPADFSYRNFDVHLAERKNPTERLLKMSRSLREVYSVLFLDCAPGISLLSENVLRAADAIIVPLLPTPLSVRMLAQLQEFISAKGWTDLKLLPFFSMVDRRNCQDPRAISGDACDRGSVLERDRTHDAAPCAHTGLRSQKSRCAGLFGPLGRGYVLNLGWKMTAASTSRLWRPFSAARSAKEPRSTRRNSIPTTTAAGRCSCHPAGRRRRQYPTCL
jgi:chromosome partitioning protein